MNQWYQSHPHRLHKRPSDRAGCNSYGCDGGTALMFRDTKSDKAVTTDVARRVVSYGRVGDAVQERALSVEVI